MTPARNYQIRVWEDGDISISAYDGDGHLMSYGQTDGCPKLACNVLRRTGRYRRLIKFAAMHAANAMRALDDAIEAAKAEVMT